jgi:hypothetical protein
MSPCAEVSIYLLIGIYLLILKMATNETFLIISFSFIDLFCFYEKGKILPEKTSHKGGFLNVF